MVFCCYNIPFQLIPAYPSGIIYFISAISKSIVKASLANSPIQFRDQGILDIHADRQQLIKANFHIILFYIVNKHPCLGRCTIACSIGAAAVQHVPDSSYSL
jgi:hypothetical protein